MRNLTKERYLELKYFCQQYSQKKREALCNTSSGRKAKMDVLLIEQLAADVDKPLSEYIIKHVTTGTPYEKLIGCPCGRRQFYNKRNEFYTRLSKVK